MARWELRRLAVRLRSYVGLTGAAILPLLTTWGLYRALGHPGRHRLGLVGGLVNGFHVPLLALLAGGTLLLPLLLAVVAGDLVAGEAAEGTLRQLLLRPIRRGQLLAAKGCAAIVYSLLLPLVVALVGLAAGGSTFGLGPMPTLSGTLVPPAQALVAVLAVVGFTWVALLSVAGWALFFSVLCDNGVTAVALTVGVLVVAEVVSRLPYFAFAAPYIFTTYFDYATNLLRSPINWPPIYHAVEVLLLYAGVLYALAHAVFTRRDFLR